MSHGAKCFNTPKSYTADISLPKDTRKYIKKEHKMTIVRQMYQLTPSRYIDDQRTLESDWNRGTPGLAQVLVLHATFP